MKVGESLYIQNELSNSALLLSIPHSGLHIPDEIEILCNPLAKRNHTDWFLPELADANSYTIIQATVSRYIVDVNRFKPTQKHTIQPIIPRTDEEGTPLFKNFPSKQKQRQWIQNYYEPYYRKIEEILTQKLSIHQQVFLLDLHSYDDSLFPSHEMILGSRKQTSISKNSLKRIEDLFQEQDLPTRLDIPFSGGSIVATFGKQERVEALQIEIPYSFYLKEGKPDKIKFYQLQEKLHHIFDQLNNENT